MISCLYGALLHIDWCDIPKCNLGLPDPLESGKPPLFAHCGVLLLQSFEALWDSQSLISSIIHREDFSITVWLFSGTVSQIICIYPYSVPMTSKMNANHEFLSWNADLASSCVNSSNTYKSSVDNCYHVLFFFWQPANHKTDKPKVADQLNHENSCQRVNCICFNRKLLCAKNSFEY